MKKAIFVDRDGTIIVEPADEQIDSLEKLEFVPGAISSLKSMMNLGFELVMASNQDGLGTESFLMEDFLPAHEKMLRTLTGEGIEFDDYLIDTHFPEDESPMRKPGTGMFGKYLGGDYDLAGSFVIGDRDSDGQLAANLGAKWLRIDSASPSASWAAAAEAVRSSERKAVIERKTAETDIIAEIDLDAKGNSEISTGLKFLDHMLDQIVHHGGVSLTIRCNGDLEVDEHHTMEDVGIALGEAIYKALGSKRGIERYGFEMVTMDDTAATVALDFSGRPYLIWDVEFTLPMIGSVPTELFRHFFQSFAASAKCNLYISALRGGDSHHTAEAVFKAFARAIRKAVRRIPGETGISSTKGVL